EDYRRFLAWSFDQVAAQSTPARPQLQRALSAVEDPPSMTACLMMDYVLIILRQVLEKAIDLFESYPYTAVEGDTLEGIAERFGLVDSGAVARIVRTNQGQSGFWAEGTSFEAVAGAERTREGDSLSSLGARVGLQAVNVASAIQHQTHLLIPKVELQVAAGVYTLQPDDTFDEVASSFFTTVEKIEESNPGLTQMPTPPGQSVPVGQLIQIPTVEFPVGGPGALSLAEIAGRFRINVVDLATRNADRPLFLTGVRAFLPLSAQIGQGETLEGLAKPFDLEVKDLLPVVGNAQGWLVNGTEIQVTGGSYLLRRNDTVAGIATRYGTTQAAIFSANPGFIWTPAAGLQVPWGKVIKLPTARVEIGAVDPLDNRPLDTLDSIGRFVGLGVSELVTQIQADSKLLLPLASLQLPVLTRSVGADDTLEAIARRFGVSALALALANPGPENRFGEVLVPEAEVLPKAALLEAL
ncbi:MAG: LysM domain-containing protein, partial [Acidobacteriota bacterium]